MSTTIKMVRTSITSLTYMYYNTPSLGNVLNTDVKSSDQAMGTFCLFSTLAFGAWTCLLYIFRNDVICTAPNRHIPGTSLGGAQQIPTDEEKVQLKVKDVPATMSTKDDSVARGITMEPDEVVDIDLEEESEAF